MTDGLGVRLGVIGGLGPLASADFYRKITELTPARADHEHLPLVLLSMPQLPDRTKAILSGSEDVAKQLLVAVRTLDQLGVESIAIPCNTAHHWFDRLAAATSARMVHIVDSVIEEMDRSVAGRRVAVLATPGTLASGFYQDRLLAAGYEPCVPGPAVFQVEVDRAISRVKAGDVAGARQALGLALACCREAGVDAAILACTELSVMSREVEARELAIVDSNTALALSCLRLLGMLEAAGPRALSSRRAG